MMNFRGRLVPPLPASYFGNAVYCAHHEDEWMAPSEDEKEEEVSETADKCKEFVKRMASLASLVHNDLREQVTVKQNLRG